jgi:hypothetical protein
VNEADPTNGFAVSLRFYGDLSFFLKRSESGGQVVRRLREKTSIKDVIESCGVPHPEVDLILCDGVPREFGFHLDRDTEVAVYPVSSSLDTHKAHGLQRRHITRFVADGHLGKLARDLRLLGFDTVYRNDADDTALMHTAIEEQRALLTRDRRLLMHARIRDGYCPRSDFVEDQIVEVMHRFDLRGGVRPYTRCLRCNGALEAVEKSAVMQELEALTKIYYEDFRRCRDCARVYWSGSHFAKLEARIEGIRARLQSPISNENWA